MRLCRKNKSKLYYSLYKEEEITYLKDDNGNIVYEDIDGEEVPVETGHKPPTYDEPVEFKGYIQFQGGESEARAFGVSLDSYSHILVMRRGEIPIDETSKIISDKTYKVTKVAESLNFVTYLLRVEDANDQN